MTELYSPEEERRFRRRDRISRAAAWTVLLGGLGACVWMCCHARTGNAGQLLKASILVSTLAGWVFAPLLMCAAGPARAEYRHIAGILAGQPEACEGTLTVEKESMCLPRSIAVRRALLTENGETIALSLNARLARRMPPDGTRVRVRTVRRYITAFEVCDEESI